MLMLRQVVVMLFSLVKGIMKKNSLMKSSEKVENNGTEPVEYVKVAVTFYDGSGNVVGTENTYADPSDLAPGMKSPFKILISNDSVIEVIGTCDFTISWVMLTVPSGMSTDSGNFSKI
jgi:hypothetical protein